MPYAVLEKEIQTLPPAALSEVVDFIRLIKMKFQEKDTLPAKESLYGVWKTIVSICLLILMNLLMILRSSSITK